MVTRVDSVLGLLVLGEAAKSNMQCLHVLLDLSLELVAQRPDSLQKQVMVGTTADDFILILSNESWVIKSLRHFALLLWIKHPEFC